MSEATAFQRETVTRIMTRYGFAAIEVDFAPGEFGAMLVEAMQAQAAEDEQRLLEQVDEIDSTTVAEAHRRLRQAEQQRDEERSAALSWRQLCQSRTDAMHRYRQQRDAAVALLREFIDIADISVPDAYSQPCVDEAVSQMRDKFDALLKDQTDDRHTPGTNPVSA